MAHLVTSAPLRAGHLPVSGQLCEAAAEGSSPDAPVCCGLSACRHSLLDHPFPPHRSWASLTVGLPGRTRTSTGFSRSARTRSDRRGCPLYPGPRCSHDRPTVPGRHCRFPAAGPAPSAASHYPGVEITRHQTRVSLALTRPVFPLPVAPVWSGRPCAFPRCFAPRRCQRRTSGWGRITNTSPKLTAVYIPILQSVNSLVPCDLVSQLWPFGLPAFAS